MRSLSAGAATLRWTARRIEQSASPSLAGFGGGEGGLAGGEVDRQDRVQREGELDDPEQDDEEEREDQDEFDQGLAFLPAATTASAGSRVDG